MKELIQGMYDKVVVNEEKKAEIRKSLQEQQIKITHRKKIFRVGIVAAAVMMFTAVSLAPNTGNYVYAAINYIKEFFTAADGSEIEIQKDENKIAVKHNKASSQGYTDVENYRLFFVLDDIREDITDVCSETEYFRYEKINTDGSKSVILVGGTVAENGWIELMFDANGKYVNNRMSLQAETVENQPWTEISMHNEGVPCGNPYYDFQPEK